LLEQEMRLTAETEMVQIWLLLSIADGYEMIGETKRALSLLDQWRVVRDKLGIGGGDSLFYCLRARLSLHGGSDDEAEKNFRKAIEMAVVRHTRSWELRSSLGLAQLLAKQGRRDEARTMLAESITGSAKASTP
jgi:ATP/maltotriose-dependent transcriptional regulator MalT